MASSRIFLEESSEIHVQNIKSGIMLIFYDTKVADYCALITLLLINPEIQPWIFSMMNFSRILALFIPYLLCVYGMILDLFKISFALWLGSYYWKQLRKQDSKADRNSKQKLDSSLPGILKKDVQLHANTEMQDLVSKPTQTTIASPDLDELSRLLKSENGLEKLSTEEILTLLDAKLIAIYELEKIFGDTRAVQLRRLWLSKRSDRMPALSQIPYSDFDYSLVTNACCENVIGHVPVPLGYAGPLKVDGLAYYIPMATTEGCLVASTNRGCRAASAADGIQTALIQDSMTRAPVVEFENLAETEAFVKWTKNTENFQIMKRHFDGTSRYAKLKSIKSIMAGRKVYLRFSATTGDAMGMNMVSKAAELVLTILHDRYFKNMRLLSISGNVCADKKPAAVNWIEGRGKSVVAEAIVPAKVVGNVLKSTVREMVQLNQSKNLIGSAMAGSLGGFNAHSANMVAAIFIATGQDAAQVVSSCNCLTQLEEMESGDLLISCTMPSLEVGTIGGGTILPAQKACLQMLGVAGGNDAEPGANSRQLARIVVAAVLAGELSLLAALSAGHLVRSHMKHNRSSQIQNQQPIPIQDKENCLSKSPHLRGVQRPKIGVNEDAIPASCSKVLI